MDKLWKENEEKCFNYLKNKFSSDKIKFEKCGEYNPTQSDIKVTIDNQVFYIEVKMDNAQCGQFVLIPNNITKSFEYSLKNKEPLNTYSNNIKEYMDYNFDKYINANTKGEPLPDSLSNNFENWILNHYQNKNVKFIITRHNNDFIIFPLSEFFKYFKVSATYRIKKSGSSEPPQKSLPLLKKYILDNYNANLKIFNKKIFIESNRIHDNTKFILNNVEYMFSKNDCHNIYEYQIRKLSKTNNANVIFSIKCHLSQQLNDLENFTNYINKAII